MRVEVERHALRHKVFHLEAPLRALVIPGIGANVPHAGWRTGIQRVGKLVEPPFLRLAYDGAHHLAVRLHYLQLHWLGRERLAVPVAQQRVEDHRFTRAIEIAWTKHKQLLAVARLTGNGELGQIQRR